ncbi:lipoyl synthase [Endomicrobium proavitum]|uniref:Lipoyl synthase n=1 Tax=Endomicrobium proavitum TaxID=1408281 RepID=A0A0G3WJ15_9BACT|nr:lipoyl synthase [Endomicrobium proavitum]AKL97877.1 Lipoyl synthase [Endomicrobium proavitum]
MKTAKKKIIIADIAALKKNFAYNGLNTVCQSAKCPNIGECYKNKTATFLILGKNCTRACAFCGVDKFTPEPLDADEPKRVARAIKDLGLSYSVITSVTRDDLPDGGAEHFARTITEIKNSIPNVKIEVLVPDFKGEQSSLNIVLAAKPDVFSHNLETVAPLYNMARKGADYKRSLDVLKYAKRKGFKVKTGIMTGLGETLSQIFNLIDDVKNAGIDILTVGQYLAPTKKHLPVVKEYSPKEFEEIEKYALKINIPKIVCGRYVRSSYLAEKHYNS